MRVDKDIDRGNWLIFQAWECGEVSMYFLFHFSFVLIFSFIFDTSTSNSFLFYQSLRKLIGWIYVISISRFLILNHLTGSIRLGGFSSASSIDFRYDFLTRISVAMRVLSDPTLRERPHPFERTWDWAVSIDQIFGRDFRLIHECFRSFPF